MPTTFSAAGTVPEADITASLAGASHVPFWLDDPARPEASAPLAGERSCDLAIVGAGFTGLWTALQASERDPGRRILVLDGGRIGWAASGRNGGFCEASLTHGYDNGEKHLPEENAELTRLGYENLDAIEAAVTRYQLDCDFQRTGLISIATEDYQTAELQAAAAEAGAGQAAGGAGAVWEGAGGAEHPAVAEDVEYLDTAALRARIDSPTYRGGLRMSRECAILNPAKLCWELARVCRERGVEFCENTIVRGIADRGDHVELTSDGGRVRAAAVALGTNAFPALLKRVRLHTVPVYDYALMTEPLSAAVWEAIGWQDREGLADAGNRFHYYRRTVDDRVLFGGWDAVYHFGGTVESRHDTRPETFRTLAQHFFQTFPQAAGTRFTHAWGGAIDTCTRFFPFFETAYGGKVAYAAGFTGLGVGASRFAGTVMLDLLAGTPTALTELEMVRRKPLPFPPEPFMWAGAQLTTAALIRADENEGRRGLLLKTLDAFGVGFDS